MSNRRTSNAATTPQGTPLAYPSCWANCRFLGRPNPSENPSPASSSRFKVCQFFFLAVKFFIFVCFLCFDCATRSRRAAVEFLLFVFPFYCQRAVDGASSTPSVPPPQPALCPLPFQQRQLPNSVTLQLQLRLWLRLRLRLRLRLQLRLGVDSCWLSSDVAFPSDFYAFRLFPHVVSAAFPAWPSSVCWLTRAHSLSLSLSLLLALCLSLVRSAFFNLSFIFCGIFCPFSTARDFQRIAAGVILLHPLVEQSLSSFRVDSYYFAFKNRFAFVYK